MKKSAILPVAVLLLIALAPHAHAADILDQLMTSYRTVSGQVIGKSPRHCSARSSAFR